MFLLNNNKFQTSKEVSNHYNYKFIQQLQIIAEIILPLRIREIFWQVQIAIQTEIESKPERLSAVSQVSRIII
jgi:hypothetical protein